MTTVLLVEDHVRLGEIIARLLSEQGNFQIWAIVQSAEAALDTLFALPAATAMPDIALVDNKLPVMSGIELVVELQQRYPDLPCLMVSGDIATHTIRRALTAGVQGYVAKDDALSLGEALTTILGGESYLSRTIQQVLAN